MGLPLLVVTLARKPLIATVAQNVIKHGTGGLAIDASRIATSSPRPVLEPTGRTGNVFGSGLEGSRYIGDTMVGRFPANLILIGPEAAEGLDEQSGVLTSGTRNGQRKEHAEFGTFTDRARDTGYFKEGDTGGASRFFKNIASID